MYKKDITTFFFLAGNECQLHKPKRELELQISFLNNWKKTKPISPHPCSSPLYTYLEQPFQLSLHKEVQELKTPLLKSVQPRGEMRKHPGITCEDWCHSAAHGVLQLLGKHLPGYIAPGPVPLFSGFAPRHILTPVGMTTFLLVFYCYGKILFNAWPISFLSSAELCSICFVFYTFNSDGRTIKSWENTCSVVLFYFLRC